MADVLNFAFCEIARVSHSRNSTFCNKPPYVSGSTPRNGVARCREMAAQAQHIASYVNDPARSRYVELSTQLMALADEMETELSTGRSGNGG